MVVMMDNPTCVGIVIVVPGEGHGDPNADAKVTSLEHDALLFAHCYAYTTEAYNGGVCQCIKHSTGHTTVQYRDTITIPPYLLYTVPFHMHYGTLV
jgi:hypothetical protein